MQPVRQVQLLHVDEAALGPRLPPRQLLHQIRARDGAPPPHPNHRQPLVQRPQRRDVVDQGNGARRERLPLAEVLCAVAARRRDECAAEQLRRVVLRREGVAAELEAVAPQRRQRRLPAPVQLHGAQGEQLRAVRSRCGRGCQKLPLPQIRVSRPQRQGPELRVRAHAGPGTANGTVVVSGVRGVHAADERVLQEREVGVARGLVAGKLPVPTDKHRHRVPNPRQSAAHERRQHLQVVQHDARAAVGPHPAGTGRGVALRLVDPAVARHDLCEPLEHIPGQQVAGERGGESDRGLPSWGEADGERAVPILGHGCECTEPVQEAAAHAALDMAHRSAPCDDGHQTGPRHNRRASGRPLA